MAVQEKPNSRFLSLWNILLMAKIKTVTISSFMKLNVIATVQIVVETYDSMESHWDPSSWDCEYLQYTKFYRNPTVECYSTFSQNQKCQTYDGTKRDVRISAK